MIEKLLRFQTIPGPYLGENRLVPTATVTQSFQVLVNKPAPAAPPVLQSITQHLQLNVQLKPAGAQTPAPSHLLVSPLQIMPSPKLSPITSAQLQQHPVSCFLDPHIEELLLLEAFKRQGRKRQLDQLVPSPNAQLSFLAIERPFSRTAASRRKLAIQGLSFMRFRFVWEDDEQASQQQQHSQQDSQPDLQPDTQQEQEADFEA